MSKSGVAKFRPLLRAHYNHVIPLIVKSFMPDAQEQYDDAMFAFSTGDYDAAITRLQALLSEEPDHFEARLALGMAHYRKGDYTSAIVEGHKAEQLKPKEQLVHTNLSLFYMKSGDKKTAEHHGLQARIASWKDNMAPPGAASATDPDLALAQPKPPPMKLPEKFPEMPWKKKPSLTTSPPTGPSDKPPQDPPHP